MLSDTHRLQLLNLLQANPQISQRELAQTMGVSLGKANYCLKALIDKGHVKFGNFRNSNRKRQYAYLLTPAGIEEKARITLSFLKRRLAEYEALKKEIQQLRGEARTIDVELTSSSASANASSFVVRPKTGATTPEIHDSPRSRP